MSIRGMSRADRNRWSSVRTVADLGELMALWLEGKIASRPGYAAHYGPDEETAHLVPVLAALCRAGYVTTQSQPGLAGTGADGRWWEQRAAVEMVVTDPFLLRRLAGAVCGAGMLVRIAEADQAVVVTTRDREPMTAFGGRVSRAHLLDQWAELEPRFADQVARGTYVSVVAPEYGPAGERLWRTLGRLRGLSR
ncbi:hypothetical protein ABR738_37385 [Streptomyces sp. Edi4]|uniref:DUF6919 domain-containing protein n=1 Tax=Streptomyces sp. Edi4 TaxID=3162527 RepID=UPI003305D59A